MHQGLQQPWGTLAQTSPYRHGSSSALLRALDEESSTKTTATSLLHLPKQFHHPLLGPRLNSLSDTERQPFLGGNTEPAVEVQGEQGGPGPHGQGVQGTPTPAPPPSASPRHRERPRTAPAPHRPRPHSTWSPQTPLTPRTKSSPPTPPAQLQFLTAPSFLSHSSRPPAQKAERERNKE